MQRFSALIFAAVLCGAFFVSTAERRLLTPASTSPFIDNVNGGTTKSATAPSSDTNGRRLLAGNGGAGSSGASYAGTSMSDSAMGPSSSSGRKLLTPASTAPFIDNVNGGTTRSATAPSGDTSGRRLLAGNGGAGSNGASYAGISMSDSAMGPSTGRKLLTPASTAPFIDNVNGGTTRSATAPSSDTSGRKLLAGNGGAGSSGASYAGTSMSDSAMGPSSSSGRRLQQFGGVNGAAYARDGNSHSLIGGSDAPANGRHLLAESN